MKKKSFYFIMIVLLLITLTGCDSNVITSDSPNISNNSSNSNKKKVYNLNEDVYITNSDGEYRLKIIGISETTERNQFSDTQADRVVIISYEYENISLSNDLYISTWDFKAYDSDNNALETYPADTKYSNSISLGRKTDASMAYALNNSNNYIELEFYDNMFNSSSNCIFKLEW